MTQVNPVYSTNALVEHLNAKSSIKLYFTKSNIKTWFNKYALYPVRIDVDEVTINEPVRYALSRQYGFAVQYSKYDFWVLDIDATTKTSFTGADSQLHYSYKTQLHFITDKHIIESIVDAVLVNTHITAFTTESITDVTDSDL